MAKHLQDDLGSGNSIAVVRVVEHEPRPGGPEQRKHEAAVRQKLPEADPLRGSGRTRSDDLTAREATHAVGGAAAVTLHVSQIRGDSGIRSRA